MKISPVAGNSLGAVTSAQSAASPDKRESAKQAFLGKTGTVIMPSDIPNGNTQSPDLNVRKIKMNVNRSPDRIDSIEDIDTKSATIDTNDKEIESEVTRPISPQFAELARQKRALQVKEREIATREKSLEEKAGAGSLDFAKLKASPLKALKEAGVTYEQLTEEILADQNGHNPEVEALRAKVEALEKGVDQKFQSREAAAEASTLTEMLNEARSLSKDGDDYEMIRGKGAHERVIQHIYDHYKKTGEILEVKSVMDRFENHLLEQAYKDANYNKVRSKLTPAQQDQAAGQRFRTLTNRQTANAPMDKRSRAIAAMNGTLKK